MVLEHFAQSVPGGTQDGARVFGRRPLLDSSKGHSIGTSGAQTYAVDAAVSSEDHPDLWID
jgi:hypothetical protein